MFVFRCMTVFLLVLFCNRNCTTSQDVVDFVRKRLINLKNGEPLSEVNQDKEQTVSMICEEVGGAFNDGWNFL